MQNFREWLQEETTAADIAPVDTKLNMKNSAQKRNKKCAEHFKVDCSICRK